MPERNETLFRKVADAIERTPERYDQRHWCGTTGCIAGWTFNILHPEARTIGKGQREDVAKQRADKLAGGDFVTEAANALGLGEDESELLFDGAWRPHEGLSVPDALRKVGEGADISDVTD